MTHRGGICNALVDALDGNAERRAVVQLDGEVAREGDADAGLQEGHVRIINRSSWHRDVVGPLVCLQTVLVALVLSWWRHLPPAHPST